MCAEPIADEHQHVVNVAARQLMCTCRGCYLLFSDPHAKLRYRAVPGPVPDVLRLHAGPSGLGGAADSRRAGVLLPQLRAWTRPSPSTRDRRAPPSPSWTSTPGAPSRRRPPAGACSPTTSRRCWCGFPTASTPIPNSTPRPSAIWCPSTPATNSSGRLRMLWRGFDGGQEVREFVDEFFDRIKARSKVADDRDAT